MSNIIELKEVKYLPESLDEGVLYVSKKYDVAGHLCPCGCGNKVITPLGPTEWKFKKNRGKPTLYPSIGNWELPCKSHYWIKEGRIEWSYQWSEEQILLGRQTEQEQKEQYLAQKRARRDKSCIYKVRSWFNKLLKNN